jgi:hypothetical protein
MAGRQRKAMDGAEEPSGREVETVDLPTEYTEAEKDTQGRIDALKDEMDSNKGGVSDADEWKAEPEGHFHTSTEDSKYQVPEMYTGVCHGGPMDGMEGQSRFPKGFVLMDEADSRAWVYDRHGEAFIARQVDNLDRERAKKAAEEANYDVRAYDVDMMKRH